MLIELNESPYKVHFPRFESFAPERLGTAKWFVDGCDYLAAVGNAISKVIIHLAQMCSLSFRRTIQSIFSLPLQQSKFLMLK